MRKPTSTLHTKMWFVVKMLAAVLIIAIIQQAAVEAKYLDDDYEEDVYDDPYDEVDADILEDEMRRMIEENLDDNQLETAQTGSQDTMDDENMDVDRRNIFQLADMVKLKTGSNALKYANYGCYCGIGGKGTPIDNLDRCCQAHDQCYSDISCRFQHFNAYSWKNDEGNIVCQSESLPCDQEQCSCDKVLAECLASHHSEYNKDFSNFWWLISKHWKC